MSYSVTLRYQDSGDDYVVLVNASIEELKSKIPMYDNTIKTHRVTFVDQSGVDISDDDDLQNAFGEFGRQNLIIKVIYTEKKKIKKGLRRSISYETHQRNNRNRVQWRPRQKICNDLAPNVSQSTREICNAFRNSGHCRFGQQCRHLHPKTPNLPQMHSKQMICAAFAHGHCRFGSRCRNLHQRQLQSPPQTVTVCNSFKNGHCTFGQNCRFVHQVQSNRAQTMGHWSSNISPSNSAQSMSQNIRICTDFKKGHCRFGPKCKFPHQIQSNRAHNAPVMVLPFRWQRIQSQNDANNADQIEGAVIDTKGANHEWIWCSYNDSMQHEQQFNDKKSKLPNKFEVLNRFRRITVFQGKVMKVHSKTLGFVEPNYPQQNASKGIPFHCDSSIDVKKDSVIEYRLQFFTKPKREYRAIDIKRIASNEERYTGKVQQVDKAKGIGIIWCSTLRELVEFDLNECTHIDIEKDDIIEYNIRNDKAVNITVLILDYKWKVWNDGMRRWHKCSYTECIEYENMYNKNHLNIETELNLDNKRLKRYTRFQGKIKRLNDDKSEGWVEYGQNSILFESEQCDFDIKMLNIGDMMSYEIDKMEENKDGVIMTRYKCVDVRFLPIRYLWKYKSLKSDANDEWNNCDVSTSKEMERNYFQRYTQSKYCKYQDIIETGNRYKRSTEFTGTIIQRAQDDVNGIINADFDDNYCNIGIKYEATECKKQFQLYDQVQFKIINTDGGIVKAVDISKPGESKRKRGNIIRIDKQRRTGYIVPYNDDNDEKSKHEYMFRFGDCNGFDVPNVLLTNVEYELRYMSGTTPWYQAVKICLYLLQYQWLTYDSSNGVWKPQNMEKSLQLDAVYNHDNKLDGSKVRINDNIRITKFQSKAMDLRGINGLLEHNYNNELKGLRLRFVSKELQFDQRYLQKGDKIIYGLKKMNGVKPHWKVVNIEFANFIPYYWKKCLPNTGSQKNKWVNVPFGQNMALERKFNPHKNVPFGKVITDTISGKQYRRHTIFRGKVVSLPTNSKSGKITLFYHRDLCNLLVDFDNKGLEKDQEYNFEITANDKGLTGFKAINIKTCFDKKIFIQYYTSKLVEIDTVNNKGKLEIPTNLSQFMDAEKEIWHYQNDRRAYIPCSKSICDKIDSLKDGDVTMYSFCGTQYNTQKISTNSAVQTNVLTRFKRCLKKRISAEKQSQKYISFTFADCKGFNAAHLNTDCILEYNVSVNNDYNNDDIKDGNDGSDEFAFKAIKVRIPMFPYRWITYDKAIKKSIYETRENSIEYEKKYNNEHKSIDTFIDGENGQRLRRITRFFGTILKIEESSKRGQVRINYSKEYGKEIGVWFNFRDCIFNPHYLKVGDLVEYNLRGHNAGNVRLWLIPFKWKYKVNDNENKNDDEEWIDFTYHQCREMEHQYNDSRDDDFKDIAVVHNAQSIIARRITTFTSKIVFDKRNRNICSLNIVYSRDQNLGLRISYDFADVNHQNIRSYNLVQFELKRDSLKKIWNVCNIKKVKYENKSKILLQKQQQQLEDLQKKYEELENNTTVQYKWKWKGDDGSYNLYKPDISNQLNKLKINRSITLTMNKWKYTITKVRDDIAEQINDSTKTQRKIKRFKDNTVNAQDLLSIPDGEYYEKTFDKLSDDEIKTLFEKTVGKSYEIEEIEDLMDDAQTFQYEVNLWKKCVQLSKSRQEVEKYLWHGTSYDISNIIIQNGFDRSYSTKAAYGKGTYFAVKASYSVKNIRYCPVHSDGYQYILLCKVIVGDSTNGSRSIKRVPLKSDQTEYDTLVDDVSDPTIYVVWRDWSAFPMYRVKFKKQPLKGIGDFLL